jgi:hypothetical protein
MEQILLPATTEPPSPAPPISEHLAPQDSSMLPPDPDTESQLSMTEREQHLLEREREILAREAELESRERKLESREWERAHSELELETAAAALLMRQAESEDAVRELAEVRGAWMALNKEVHGMRQSSAALRVQNMQERAQWEAREEVLRQEMREMAALLARQVEREEAESLQEGAGGRNPPLEGDSEALCLGCGWGKTLEDADCERCGWTSGGAGEEEEGSLSLEDKARLMFVSWDKNRDGFLSRGQVKQQMQQEACFEALIQGEDFHWKGLWERYDVDGGGVVQQAEFVTLCTDCLGHPVLVQPAIVASTLPPPTEMSAQAGRAPTPPQDRASTKRKLEECLLHLCADVVLNSSNYSHQFDELAEQARRMGGLVKMKHIVAACERDIACRLDIWTQNMAKDRLWAACEAQVQAICMS